MAAARLEGWEKCLADYLSAARAKSFHWGKHDCALWAAGWVKLCTGNDFTKDWIHQYDSEDGAKRLMLARGFKSTADIADKALESKPLTFAQRGDLVYRAGALGICDGRNSYFVAPEGLLKESTLACERAWKV
jgi:hypothetical protein